MPTYDNQCLTCEKIFETFQSMSEKPIKICPFCGAKSKRLIGAGLAPIFKEGIGGFYQTDYKNQPKKQPRSNTPTDVNPKNDPISNKSTQKRIQSNSE